MSENPLVSVSIVSYNYGHFLPRAIDSVLAQTFTDYEIIVIDNGSTDNTPDVIKEYEGRIRHQRFEKNLGRSGGKNAGIKMAKGKYIQFLDADDTLLPEKLEKQVRILEENDEISVVYSDSLFVNEKGEPMPETSEWYRKRHFKPDDDFLKKLVQESFLLTHDSITRRDAVIGIGGFDEQEDMLEDWDFSLRLAIAGNRFYYLPETLTTCYRHSNSATSHNAEYSYKIRKNFVYKHLNDKNLKNTLGEDLYKLFKSYQHWILASNLYNLKEWKQCREQILESIRSDGWKMSFPKLQLLIKSQIHNILRH